MENAIEPIEFTVRGKPYRIFRRLIDGKRTPAWSVKFYHRRKQILRCTGEMDSKRAITKARALVERVLDEQWDAVAAMSQREAKKIPAEELKNRMSTILLRLLAGEGTDDVEVLKALESKLLLPPHLRQFAAAASRIWNVRAAFVYILVKCGTVIYVGQTTNLFVRLADHTTKRDFDEVFTIACDEGALNDVERKVISAFPNCFNKNQGNKTPNLTWPIS